MLATVLTVVVDSSVADVEGLAASVVVVVSTLVVVDSVVLEKRGAEGLNRLFRSALLKSAFRSGFRSSGSSVVVSGADVLEEEPLNLFSLCFSLSAASALDVVNLKEDGVDVWAVDDSTAGSSSSSLL